MMDAFSAFITRVFGPILMPVFDAVNNRPFAAMDLRYARFIAIGLFVLGMVFVFLLKKEYVNLGSPRKDVWHDLRFWTILSMLPHVIVYFLF